MAERSKHQYRTEKTLVVRCASGFYLLDVARVRRVVDHMTLHPSPFSVRGLAGLARFGGEPLAVFSLEALAVGEARFRDAAMTVVVIELGGDSPQRLGLAVDEALEIVSLPETDPGMAQDSLVSGPLNIDGRQAWLVNIDVLGVQGSLDRCPGVNQAKENN
ncbi:MAG: hypothetical protein DRJ61_02110 [Acidobacteria bacterium]|nr:MAG: hypothetical protein DRJ65_12115 [Acidobacteriota bacterium]RLE35892.1 MAG: hypothetical protein DRJ61_02110 [Acidobacteriota bacterium]